MGRASSFNNNTNIASNREIGSEYDSIKIVADNIADIVEIVDEDIDALITSLNEAKDFTGISVVSGEEASFDSETKTITVPTVKGDTGISGSDGTDVYQTWLDDGNTGTVAEFLTSLKGTNGVDGSDGINGTNGVNGADGSDGDKGLSPTVELTYDESTGDLEFEVTGWQEVE